MGIGPCEHAPEYRLARIQFDFSLSFEASFTPPCNISINLSSSFPCISWGSRFLFISWRPSI